MTVPKCFIEQVQALMDKKGLSQHQLAKLSGVHQPDISDLLSGVQENVTTDKLQKIARGLGCTLEILLKEQEKA